MVNASLVELGALLELSSFGGTTTTLTLNKLASETLGVL